MCVVFPVVPPLAAALPNTDETSPTVADFSRGTDVTPHGSLLSQHGGPPPTPRTQHQLETPVSPSMPHLVIHKCCPLGEVFSHQHAGCVPSEVWSFRVPIFAVDQFGGFVETNVTKDQVSDASVQVQVGNYRSISVTTALSMVGSS